MPNPEIAAIIYGLISAASWGSGDFSGGFATKKSSVAGVLLVGYIVSVVLLSICALWFGSPVPNMFSFTAAVLAGVTGLIGLAALYKGLASGQMGIVAPLAAVTTATLPVLLGGTAGGGHHRDITRSSGYVFGGISFKFADYGVSCCLCGDLASFDS